MIKGKNKKNNKKRNKKIELEKLKKELAEKGYFDAENKKPIPYLPLLRIKWSFTWVPLFFILPHVVELVSIGASY